MSVEKTDRRTDVVLHLARIVTFSTLLAYSGSILWAVPLSAALFFASFSALHDLSHGALGLPRRVREYAIAVIGALMLMSGHGQRRVHLHHHRRPLADDDLEGATARMSLARACLVWLPIAARVRIDGFRRARGRERAWVYAETVANAMGLALLLWSGVLPLQVYAVVAVAAQATMPVWAGHLSHRTPAWLARVARALAFTRSPTVLSLAFHDVHHAAPRIPCQRLADRAHGS